MCWLNEFCHYFDKKTYETSRMKYLALTLKSTIKYHAEISTQLKAPGDAILILRERPRWLLLKCPCGCDDEIPLNLDYRAGPSWRIYKEKNDRITLFPSIWRDTGCLSHFIIRNSQCLLLEKFDRDRFTYRHFEQTDFHALANRVRKSWPREGWVPYEEIAELLGEIPWDVLDVCRDLVRTNILVEGSGRRSSSFKRC